MPTGEAGENRPGQVAGDEATRGLGAGLPLLVYTALLAWSRGHPLLQPFEVMTLPAPAWSVGYFDTGRSFGPWLVALGLAGGVAWALARGGAGEAWRAAGRGRAALWVALVLGLATLVPGRPAELRSMAALAMTAPWALLLLAWLAERRGAERAERAGRWVAWAGAVSPALFAGAVGLAAFALCLAVGLLAFGGIPHVMDATIYYLEAKLFAAGRLGWELEPEVRAFFGHPFVVGSGPSVFPMYPPGWPSMLAAGMWLGTPWAVGPALVTAALLLLYLWVREVAGEGVARVAAGLGLLSPFVLAMGGEYMSHPAALALFQLSLWSYTRSLRPGASCGWGWLCGLAIGLGASTRPLTALGLSLPLGAHAMLMLGRERRRRAGWALALAVGIVLGLAPLLAHNHAVTGAWLKSPIGLHLDGTFRLGFGAGIAGNEHWPEKALANCLANFNGLNKFLFEWPVPALLFAGLFLASPVTGGSGATLALSCCGSLAAVYWLHYYQDLCLGPRYLYEISGLLLFLTALGLARAASWLEAHGRPAAQARGLLALLVAGLTLGGGALFLPGVWQQLSRDYWAVSPAPSRALREAGLGERAVALVPAELFGGLIAHEPADLRTGVVIAIDRADPGPLRAAYPGHTFWRGRTAAGRLVLERLAGGPAASGRQLDAPGSKSRARESSSSSK